MLVGGGEEGRAAEEDVTDLGCGFRLVINDAGLSVFLWSAGESGLESGIVLGNRLRIILSICWSCLKSHGV